MRSWRGGRGRSWLVCSSQCCGASRALNPARRPGSPAPLPPAPRPQAPGIPGGRRGTAAAPAFGPRRPCPRRRGAGACCRPRSAGAGSGGDQVRGENSPPTPPELGGAQASGQPVPPCASRPGRGWRATPRRRPPRRPRAPGAAPRSPCRWRGPRGRRGGARDPRSCHRRAAAGTRRAGRGAAAWSLRGRDRPCCACPGPGHPAACPSRGRAGCCHGAPWG